MYSLNFPKIFSSAKTELISDHEATSQNLKLLLMSDRTSLFGDPYFGTILKTLIFEQGDYILQDLVIDEIYTTILTFMPQIQLKRTDISLEVKQSAIYVNIKCVNLIDYKIDLYSIKLMEINEEV